MLFSTTGVGKSVWVVEAATCWSVGKPFVGIEPTRPLAIWLIEVEDTEEEVALMREGMVAARVALACSVPEGGGGSYVTRDHWLQRYHWPQGDAGVVTGAPRTLCLA